MKGDFADQLDTPSIEADQDQPKRVYVSVKDTRGHGLAFLAISILIIVAFWIVVGALAAAPGTDGCGLAACCKVSEVQLFGIVVLAGAAGAAIHAITSFVTFVGNRLLIRSWLWWLYLRIPIGILLGILVYLAIRAGVFGSYTFEGCKDIFFVALIAGLSGLFSKQVADKLSDLVDNLLVPAQRPQRKDSLKENGGSAKSDEAAAATKLPPVQGEETIQRVQRLLIQLKYLDTTTERDQSSTDGVLGPKTRKAIERFLKDNKIVGEIRTATIGAETDPDFWPNLINLLENAVKAKSQSDTGQKSP